MVVFVSLFNVIVMSVKTINFETYEESFAVSTERKENYGEILTPFSIIREMVEYIPLHIRFNRSVKYIDPACGTGHFPMVLFNHLRELWSQNTQTCDPFSTKEAIEEYILENSLFLCELNSIHRENLVKLFGASAKIRMGDFLTMTRNSILGGTCESSTQICIIGNPPYNSGGFVKVPTNTSLNKKKDGVALWREFIRHSISIMNNGDYLTMIVPSIWMKPDKEGIYNLICQYKLHYIRCFTNTETNHIFHGNAQTPTCMFLMEKIPTDGCVSLFNKQSGCYKTYKFDHTKGSSIPLCGSSIVQTMNTYVDLYGSIKITKTNMPRKGITLCLTSDEQHIYPAIHTCKLMNKNQPMLEKRYSNKPCAFYGVKKIVMAHKMYGFPYFDRTGTYGISNRDSYIIHDPSYSDEDYEHLVCFLSSKLVLYLFETTRYRMKFLEKYAFHFIPDITKMDDVSDIVSLNDKELCMYFGLDDRDTKSVLELHKKQYLKCIDQKLIIV